jgi:hypothetical protein
MPWWSWILIWGGLVLALIGMFVFLGWRLFRKATAALRELSRLADKTALLSAGADGLTDHSFTPAVLREHSDVVANHRRVADARASRREARRVKRFTRGRLLTSADYRHAAAQIKGV